MKKILFSIFLAGFFFFGIGLLISLFASKAYAGPQGFGWAKYESITYNRVCSGNNARIVVRLRTEGGTQLSGGSITLNGVTGQSGSSFGCMNVSGNFFLSALRSGYQSMSTGFTLHTNVQSAGPTYIVNIGVYMTNTRTIEIISPTGGWSATTPTFYLYTRSLIGSSSADIYAFVDGTLYLVGDNKPFGNVSVSLPSLSVGSHNIYFFFGENSSPYPVSAFSAPVTITVGGRPDL